MTEEEKMSSAMGEERSGEDGGAAQPDPSAADVANDRVALDRELSEARAKANTYLDLAQRTQADFVNYKRRIEQERSDYARGARADIILRLLGPLDDLDRAVGSLPANVAGSDWAQGFVLIDRKYHAALEAVGVKTIEAAGKPFDPYQHEAIAHEPSDSVPPESVTKVVAPGYAIDGKVIRPAQVVVSSGPARVGSQ